MEGRAAQCKGRNGALPVQGPSPGGGELAVLQDARLHPCYCCRAWGIFQKAGFHLCHPKGVSRAACALCVRGRLTVPPRTKAPLAARVSQRGSFSQTCITLKHRRRVLGCKTIKCVVREQDSVLTEQTSSTDGSLTLQGSPSLQMAGALLAPAGKDPTSWGPTHLPPPAGPARWLAEWRAPSHPRQPEASAEGGGGLARQVSRGRERAGCAHRAKGIQGRRQSREAELADAQG